MEPSSEDELGDQIVKRAPNSLNFDVFKFCMTHGSMLVINGAGVDISVRIPWPYPLLHANRLYSILLYTPVFLSVGPVRNYVGIRQLMVCQF